MKSKAKVVVIGGGRCRSQHALSSWQKKAGRMWSLVERKELTSGSTWHAAGLITPFQYELFSWPIA